MAVISNSLLRKTNKSRQSKRFFTSVKFCPNLKFDYIQTQFYCKPIIRNDFLSRFNEQNKQYSKSQFALLLHLIDPEYTLQGACTLKSKLDFSYIGDIHYIVVRCTISYYIVIYYIFGLVLNINVGFELLRPKRCDLRLGNISQSEYNINQLWF